MFTFSETINEIKRRSDYNNMSLVGKIICNVVAYSGVTKLLFKKLFR